MKILLDECIDQTIPEILRPFGHEVSHVKLDPSLRGRKDEELADIVSQEYDVWVTHDCFRQLPEWLAVHRHLALGNISVILISIHRSVTDWQLATTLALLTTMKQWTEQLGNTHCLAKLHHPKGGAQFFTRDEVAEMIRKRISGTTRADVGEADLSASPE